MNKVREALRYYLYSYRIEQFYSFWILQHILWRQNTSAYIYLVVKTFPEVWAVNTYRFEVKAGFTLVRLFSNIALNIPTRLFHQASQRPSFAGHVATLKAVME